MDKIQQLEAQLAAAVSEADKIDALNALALAVSENDPARAYQLTTDAHQRAQSGQFRTTHYAKGVADSLAVFAWYYYEQLSDYRAALEFVTESLTLSKSIHHTAGEIRAIYQRGLIHHNIGNYPQALDSYLAAIDRARQFDHPFLQAQTLRAMARLYSDLDDPATMLSYNQAALAIFADLHDEFYYPLLLNNTGMALMYVGHLDEALETAFQALGEFEKIDSWRGMSAAEDTIGQIYAAMGDFGQATVYMQRGVERIGRNGEKRRLSRAVLNLGKLYLQQQRPDDALPHLHHALAISLDIASNPLLYECHRSLSIAYEQKGDFEQALFHHKAYLETYREVVNEQSVQQLKLFEVIHRTEQAEAEAETQRQLREQERGYFERLSQMRDQLISTTSHDLKNPLTAITNYVHLLDKQRQTDDDISQRYLKRIEAQVEQMRDLIGDLLDLAKLETVRSLNCETVALSQFLDQITADFASHAQKKDIHIRTSVEPHDLSLDFDPRQMRRVLNNLISNAIKYTPIGGQAQITVSQSGDKVVIAVEDTGIGIPAKDLPHIFERFYRVDSEAHASIDGMGLGLAIVKSIVEQHGGAISVASEEGVGSRFELTLPAMEGAVTG